MNINAALQNGLIATLSPFVVFAVSRAQLEAKYQISKSQIYLCSNITEKRELKQLQTFTDCVLPWPCCGWTRSHWRWSRPWRRWPRCCTCCSCSAAIRCYVLNRSTLSTTLTGQTIIFRHSSASLQPSSGLRSRPCTMAFTWSRDRFRAHSNCSNCCPQWPTSDELTTQPCALRTFSKVCWMLSSLIRAVNEISRYFHIIRTVWLAKCLKAFDDSCIPDGAAAVLDQDCPEAELQGVVSSGGWTLQDQIIL